MRGAPVHVGVQWPTAEAARQCPKGFIDLHYCSQCGHVYNAAFDPALVTYSEEYDNSLYHSPRFREYTRTLARRLVERYDLHGKRIVEIGCGQGDFLRLLARMGDNQAVGFDPSYEPDPGNEPASGEEEQVTFVQEFYSERHAADYPADFICSRYVFEHIPDPTSFLRMVRGPLGGDAPSAAVYFEVPNVLSTLRDLSIWEIVYEHCSFFSPRSLAYAFIRSGFRICDLNEEYAGQFLGIEAVPRPAHAPEHLNGWGAGEDLEVQVRRFRARFADRAAQWSQRLEQVRRDGKRAVIWGAGARAVTFTNLLDADAPVVIEYAVDINPNKHGRFLAGTGQEIVPPAFLTDYRPDLVIAMNPVYQSEIQASLDDLGVLADLLCAS